MRSRPDQQQYADAISDGLQSEQSLDEPPWIDWAAVEVGGTLGGLDLVRQGFWELSKPAEPVRYGFATSFCTFHCSHINRCHLCCTVLVLLSTTRSFSRVCLVTDSSADATAQAQLPLLVLLALTLFDTRAGVLHC